MYGCAVLEVGPETKLAVVRLRQGSKRRRRNNQDAAPTAGGAGGVQQADSLSRKKAAMQTVIHVMQDKEELPLSNLISEANMVAPSGEAFTKAELVDALSALDNDNKIMFYDNMIHRV